MVFLINKTVFSSTTYEAISSLSSKLPFQEHLISRTQTQLGELSSTVKKR